MTAAESTDARRASAIFHLLGASSEVRLCADACLELRPARSACSRCRDVCPVQAFEWTDEGVGLNARCTGCGLCAATCPSGAIRVAGFEPAKFNSAVQRIECGRVPDHIAGDAAKVPCLGGVSATVVLGLAASSSTPWSLVDRGWCATCPMGNGTAVIAAETLEFTDSRLDALGLAQARWPSMVHEPLPAGTAQPIKVPVNASHVSRRSFFSSLARTVQKAAVHKAPVTADRGGCLPSPVIQQHRKRFADAVKTLATEVDGAVPASFFPVIEVDAHCDDRGPCTALCPSGALRRYADDVSGTLGLQFDARMCVACGLCVRECPSAAVRLLPTGNGDAIAANGPKTLTSRTPRICCECGSSFVGADSNDLCPRCHTDRSLALSMFGTKLAVRPLADRTSHTHYSATCSSEDARHEQ